MKFVKFPFKIEKQYRLPGYDYSDSGYYFVTICTDGRINFLGEIKNQKMQLSPVGRVASSYLVKISKQFPLSRLLAFSIMPNHVHLLIEICPVGRNAPWRVPTKTPETIHPLINNSVSSIVNHFKGFVTKESRKLNPKFKWQTRFHDRVIRNEKEYWAIKRYIQDNPKNWDKDKENKNSYFQGTEKCQ